MDLTFNFNTVLALLMPALVGFMVWYIQSKINARAAAAIMERAEFADERARTVEQNRARIETEYKQVLARLEDVEKAGTADAQSLALLRQEMLPMAEAMKRKLVEILTHPSDDFVIPDKLLAKVKVTGAAMPAELESWLEERAVSTNPHVTEQEKLAAEALPIIVKLAQLEAEDSEAVITDVQLVSSTGLSAATKKEKEGK